MQTSNIILVLVVLAVLALSMIPIGRSRTRVRRHGPASARRALRELTTTLRSARSHPSIAELAPVSSGNPPAPT